MDVLVVGNGGREHALVAALRRDPEVGALHAAPGNPGMAASAELHELDLTDMTAIADLAEKLAVDLVVVGPEAPLVAGAADAVRGRGIACFGPSGASAQIEGSKAYAKKVMAAAGVPTARSYVCRTPAEAEEALDAFGPPYVVKDDGLAAGKGVVVTPDRAAALEHAAGCEQVVIEEFLDGPEISLFAITDGTTVLPMLPAQDFKRVGDNDEGPNTGGMGAYTPLPWAPASLVPDVLERVVQPTIDELRKQGAPFSGLLYVGLAVTSRGLRVVEFNARFGDPETQALLALLRSPLGVVLSAAANGTLAEVGPLRWHSGSAVTVVVASSGYPESPRTGDVITGLDAAGAREGVEVLHASTAFDAAGNVVTAGGRVLAVTAVGADLAEARARAYEAVGDIHIDGGHFRGDIALKAVEGSVSSA
ncbi:phosphoribosylamine--glycine ligase [Flindersiella endophytica]